MNNLTVGKRIVIGFGLLVAIIMILGVLSVKQMVGVQKGSEKLAGVYMPEIKLSNDVERNLTQIMYATRGYLYTGKEEYFEDSQKSFSKLDDSLMELRELARKLNLRELEEAESSIREKSDELASVVDRLKENFEHTLALRQQMDAKAEAFTVAIRSLNEAVEFTQQSSDEKSKNAATLALINELDRFASLARVRNVQSQQDRNPDLTRTAIKLVDSMSPIYAHLAKSLENTSARQFLAKAREASTGYRSGMESYLIARDELETLNKQRDTLGYAVYEEAHALASIGMAATLHIAEESVQSLTVAEFELIIGTIVAMILGVVLAWVITRSITGPLNLAIIQLSHGSAESSCAAEQVSSASQSLAEGASEQAASLEETSASMEQITTSVVQNTEVSKRTNESAQKALNAANDGVRTMGELRSDADAVSNFAREMETAMRDIKESGDSIGKIIKTIDEIAFQTNILALNAAVEAARAGEAGAGFAVVADEVRNLAHRAAEAARETAGLIKTSIERSGRGVEVNAKVGQSLKSVLEKAKTVDEALKLISEASGEVAVSMGGLECSVTEQQNGIEQINSALVQVSDVTQVNAASAEEAASAAEEMNAQSVSLREIVFTLRKMVDGQSQEQELLSRAALSGPTNNK